MTDKSISPLRRRLIEDMTIRRLSANTQHQYIRHVKNFADFVGQSLDKATAEDVRGGPRTCDSRSRFLRCNPAGFDIGSDGRCDG